MTITVTTLAAEIRTAWAEGKRLGRPRIPAEKEDAIRKARAEGMGILKIAREVGVGAAAVQHVLGSQ